MLLIQIMHVSLLHINLVLPFVDAFRGPVALMTVMKAKMEKLSTTLETFGSKSQRLRSSVQTILDLVKCIKVLPSDEIQTAGGHVFDI